MPYQAPDYSAALFRGMQIGKERRKEKKERTLTDIATQAITTSPRGEVLPSSTKGTALLSAQEINPVEKYNPDYHAELLRSKGFTKEAERVETHNVIQKKRALEIEEAKEKAKILQNIRKVDTMRLGIQMIQAGDVNGGLAVYNQAMPEGQKGVSVKLLDRDRAVVTLQDGSKKPMALSKTIESLVDPKTQYKEKQAWLRMGEAQRSAERIAAIRSGKKVLKKDEYMAANGSIFSYTQIKSRYLMKYDLMDPYDIKSLLRSGALTPEQAEEERAKWKKDIPSIEEYAKKELTINMTGKGKRRTEPESTFESLPDPKVFKEANPDKGVKDSKGNTLVPSADGKHWINQKTGERVE